MQCVFVADGASSDRVAAHRFRHINNGQGLGHNPIVPDFLTYIEKVGGSTLSD
ncbi:hypothetical protein AS9A_4188 [Hoyosella subflava DQS3-9A1]|uniref:Uncharacterized protein n=1 Tax=Hoyosella subflava (strain DSM 45089 / JCM 17490 / NBRC 109087 / DQS3-9A1) TaxID=443218 RepID=F6EK81_HOYSD|nr:hypothetical protein AS9A_4188 [Hoyosella subflava DQS3-9A1]